MIDALGWRKSKEGANLSVTKGTFPSDLSNQCYLLGTHYEPVGLLSSWFQCVAHLETPLPWWHWQWRCMLRRRIHEVDRPRVHYDETAGQTSQWCHVVEGFL